MRVLHAVVAKTEANYDFLGLLVRDTQNLPVLRKHRPSKFVREPFTGPCTETVRIYHTTSRIGDLTLTDPINSRSDTV